LERYACSENIEKLRKLRNREKPEENPPCNYTNYTNYTDYTNPAPTAKAESCNNCQEYQPDYQLCGLDGERKDPGFNCNRFQPKPIEKKCLACRFWAGSSVTQMAFCKKKGTNALQDSCCDAWEACPDA